ncbi:hypothetical protein [Paenibacillus koleovorans]|uniref:hypothetical protein n=1 Tax=Paenibacillus koleovorans TaxID=121608 RepID=UPI000FDC6185|nr:hypothetical protein [Paenibacillus koleovorans]
MKHSSDFIRIHSLAGVLMMYHKKQDLGLTISTEELVIQRPHLNYYIKLKDIVSIAPYKPHQGKSVRMVSNDDASREIARLSSDSGSYRFYVIQAIMHNRSGLTEVGKMEFVLPVAKEMLEKIGQFGAFWPVDRPPGLSD